MADSTTKDLAGTAGNATGGRNLPDVGETMGSVTNPTGNKTKGKKGKGKGNNDEEGDDEGFGLENGKDVKGSLKVHIKLDLEADIRIIARVKGDIAIGILLNGAKPNIDRIIARPVSAIQYVDVAGLKVRSNVGRTGVAMDINVLQPFRGAGPCRVA